MRKGLVLGAIQIVLVLCIGGRFLFERATRPRVWVLTEAYDPNMPVRGRYLTERLRMPTEGFTFTDPTPSLPFTSENWQWAYLQLRDGQLIAAKRGSSPGMHIALEKNPDGTVFAVSVDSVQFFVVGNAKIPILKAGEEMWVEVTLPAQGPPRPVRIGIKKDGVITPLNLD